jgi:hypothetical protein
LLEQTKTTRDRCTLERGKSALLSIWDEHSQAAAVETDKAKAIRLSEKPVQRQNSL